MKASFVTAGTEYLPAIRFRDGSRKIFHGDPVVNAGTAKKYAQIAINEYRSRKTINH